MNFGLYLKKLSVFALISLTAAISAFPQTAAVKPPRQEKLLNELKVLMWSDSTAPDVSVKIRFHAGSAFDPQGKEGLMQLLAENIFPNDAVREFFAEDLGGSLEIVSNYDYIQINATSKSEEFLSLLETLANAVANPSIDKETTAKLKAKQLEKIKELEKNRSYIADQVAAQKLLGNFPYGRKQAGTPESVQKIDFADLLLAKQRFLTADNATVTIAGNFKSDLAFRAARRYFGAWIKSDKRVPSTFRQPDEPETKHTVVENSSGSDPEIRYAMRGLARNDKDFVASKILTKILDYRFQNLAVKNSGKNNFVRESENMLPGVILFGYSTSAAIRNSGANFPQDAAAMLFSQKIGADEFSKARAEVSAEIAAKTYADWWLDVDTYKINSVAAEAKIYESVTLADVQRVAEKLAKNPAVSVLVIRTGEETSNK